MQPNSRFHVDWYVVFCKTDIKHWALRFLDPCFQHVYAVKKTNGGAFWVIVNPRRGCTTVELKSVIEYPTIRALCGDSVVLNIRSLVDGEKLRHYFWHINCVEIVKSLLGIKARWVWTPRQLYEHLKRGKYDREGKSGS